ncbi:hypothetical protein H106_01330 [Trichophyton rubrum CBS 735.88]|nr:hypothetical protein H106_01330 [Trichophyton rubrum CBS 735.88]
MQSGTALGPEASAYFSGVLVGMAEATSPHWQVKPWRDSERPREFVLPTQKMDAYTLHIIAGRLYVCGWRGRERINQRQRALAQDLYLIGPLVREAYAPVTNPGPCPDWGGTTPWLSGRDGHHPNAPR